MWTIVIIIVGILIIATIFDKIKKDRKGASTDPIKDFNDKPVKSDSGIKNNNSQSGNNTKLDRLVNLTDQKLKEFKSLNFSKSIDDAMAFKFIVALVMISLDKHGIYLEEYNNYSVRKLHNYIQQKNNKNIEYDKNREKDMFDYIARDIKFLEKILRNGKPPQGGYERHEYEIEVNNEITSIYSSLTGNYGGDGYYEGIPKFTEAIFDTFDDIDQKVQEIIV